ncbi:Argininosuccinate synthase chloroplastic [Dissostichus eleginoides]|uniref:Argininosuccinate synthase chloroplastic n=1 Tax=Dissostichus eleginoides TaxID=100907 RepID=A0AAD9C8N8_DISEL|nr:Argininosuccinate synthase chloroplastic [Dissostichus eleginoides]
MWAQLVVLNVVPREFQELDLIRAHLVHPSVALGHTAASHNGLSQLLVRTLSTICPTVSVPRSNQKR